MMETPRERRLLNRQGVEDITQIPRSTLYDRMADGTFPKPIRVGKRSVRWFEDEILEWMEGRERGGCAC